LGTGRGEPTSAPHPKLVGLHFKDVAASAGRTRALSVAWIERQLAGLCKNYALRRKRLDRRDWAMLLFGQGGGGLG